MSTNNSCPVTFMSSSDMCSDDHDTLKVMMPHMMSSGDHVPLRHSVSDRAECTGKLANLRISDSELQHSYDHE